MNRNSIRMPIFIVSPTSVDLPEIDSTVDVHIQIENVYDSSEKIFSL